MNLDNKVISRAKEYVNQLLVPLEQHYYHQYSHALEVMERAVYLAREEWLNDDDIEVLALAGLFHDTWFVIQYEHNEPFWAKIARNYLRTILYPEDRIKIIQEIILATAPSAKPNNLLEEIIKDADMDNLGRDDFFDINEKVKKELDLQ